MDSLPRAVEEAPASYAVEVGGDCHPREFRELLPCKHYFLCDIAEESEPPAIEIDGWCRALCQDGELLRQVLARGDAALGVFIRLTTRLGPLETVYAVFRVQVSS